MTKTKDQKDESPSDDILGKKQGEEIMRYVGEKSITIGVSVIAFECLKALLRTGLYGATIEDVCQRIIEERLRGMVEIGRAK